MGSFSRVVVQGAPAVLLVAWAGLGCTTSDSISDQCGADQSCNRACAMHGIPDPDCHFGAGGAAGAGATATGGSGPECDLSTAEDACDLCMRSACCAELTACDQNPECGSAISCLSACPSDDTSCVDACVARYPTGVQILSAGLDCMDSICAPECSTGTGTGTGGDNGGGQEPCALATARLDQCGMILTSCDDTTEETRCALGCYAVAACDELGALADEELAISSSLAQCIIACGPNASCADGSLLIPEDWICDDYADCADGSDELDCGGTGGSAGSPGAS